MNALKDIKIALGERLPLEVIKQFCVYVGGKFVVTGFSFLSAPIMMILLAPADYGLLSLIHSFNNIAVALLSLGLPQVFMVEYYRNDEHNRARALNDVVSIYSLCSVPIIIMSLMFPQIIQGYLFLPQQLSYVVYGVLGICFLSFFNDIFYNVLQFQQKAWTVSVTQILVSALTVCSNIVLIGLFHQTVAAAVWVQCALTAGVFGLGIIYYVRNSYHHSFDLRRTLAGVPRYVNLGVTFLPGTIVAWVFALLNKWMLARLGGLELAGIFSLADAGGLLIYRLVLHPLQGAYSPALMNSYKQQHECIRNVEESNHRVMAVVLMGLVICLVGGYVLTRTFLYCIVPASYAKSVDCVLGVALGYVWLIGAYFVSNFLQFQKRRWIFIIALLLSIAVNIGLNLFLIPIYGLHGCVGAMMISNGIYFLIMLFYNRYLLKRTDAGSCT